MRALAFITVGALVLSACTDQKNTDEDNFRHAIDAALAARPMCIDVPIESLKPAGEAGQSTFPIYVALPNATAPNDPFKGRTQPLDALTSAGLLAVGTGTIETATMFAGSHDKVAVRIYDLTDTGHKALDKPAAGLARLVEQPLLLRHARGRGDRAIHRTCRGFQPEGIPCALHVAPQGGRRLGEAASDRRAFPQVMVAMSETNEAATDVVLTNNGWVDSSTVRK